MKPDILWDIDNTVRIIVVNVVWTERKDMRLGPTRALISAHPWNSTLLQGQLCDLGKLLAHLVSSSVQL